jgi:hypothetical protein
MKTFITKSDKEILDAVQQAFDKVMIPEPTDDQTVFLRSKAASGLPQDQYEFGTHLLNQLPARDIYKKDLLPKKTREAMDSMGLAAHDEAIANLELACAQDHIPSLYMLGHAVMNKGKNLGLPKVYQKGHDYLEQLAALNSTDNSEISCIAETCLFLGKEYFYGFYKDFVHKTEDKVKAQLYFDKGIKLDPEMEYCIPN